MIPADLQAIPAGVSDPERRAALQGIISDYRRCATSIASVPDAAHQLVGQKDGGADAGDIVGPHDMRACQH